MHRLFISTVASVLVAAGVPGIGHAQAVPSASPEAMGFSSEILADAIDSLSADSIDIHSLLVSRRDSLFLDAYFHPFDAEMLHDVASVTKSVVALLTLLAVDQGDLPDLDTPFLEILPETTARGAGPGADEITIRHLLDMRSGWNCGRAPGEPELDAMRASEDWVAFALALPISDPPGSRFAYCSPNFHVLSALISAATGMSAADFAAEHLFAPIGIENFRWPSDAQGISHGWGDLSLDSEALLRIGQLMLGGGVRNGRQILRVESIDAVSGDGTSDEYRLGWWRSSDEPWQYEANGRGGQRITVIPALDVVIVMTGGGFEPAIAGELLGAAFVGDGAPGELPDATPGARPDHSRDDSLQDALERARSAPPAPEAAESIGRQREVAGRYLLGPNPLGIDSLEVAVRPDDARLILWLPGGRVLRQDVGRPGRYLLSSNQGLTSAARGWWTEPETFRVDLNLLGAIGRLYLDLRFSGDAFEADVLDRNTGERFVVTGARSRELRPRL